jgi:hypothetical protein
MSSRSGRSAACSGSSARATISCSSPVCAQRVAEHLDPQLLERMSIPLHVVAVDVITDEELPLSRGAGPEAVLASAAIRAVLPRSFGRIAA